MATVVGTVYLTGCNYQLQYDLLSQDIANNSSTVRLYGVLNVTNNYISWTRGTASVHTESGSIGTYYSKGSYTLIQRDFTWGHDSSGNFSATIAASLSTSYVSGTTSGTISLPHINRYPQLTSGEDFTDEGNPTLKFTSYGTFPIRVKLEAGGNTQLITADLDSYSATSYTFSLTDAQRTTLRKLATGTTLTVTETVCAMNSDKTSELNSSFKTYTMTIVNGEPTFSAAWKETESKVAAVYGTGCSRLLQNKSLPQITITPSAKKNATISAVTVTHNGVEYSGTVSGSTYVFTGITAVTSDFIVKVTDSRGLSTTETLSKTIDEYKPINQNYLKVYRTAQTSSNVVIVLDYTYYNKTYNSKSNTLTITYALDGGTATAYTSSQYTIDSTNNKVTSTLTKSGWVPYTSSGKVTIVVKDLFSDFTDTKDLMKGIAILDLGEKDVQINGTLFIADTEGNNPVAVSGDPVPVGAIMHYDGDTAPDGYVEYEPIFKFQKFEKAVYIGANAMASTAMGTFTTPDGYTNLCVVPIENGYGDQWIVSYCFYGGNNVYAMIHSQYGSGLSSYLKCYVVFVKTSEFSDMLIS